MSVAAAAALVPVSVLGTGTSATAATTGCSTHVASDFNGDGYADLATGAYGRNVGGEDGAGSIQVDYGSKTGLVASKSQYFDQNSTGMPTAPEYQASFGWSLVSGYFNADCYADLAIGVPGTDNSNGGVIILDGSATGLSTTNAQLISSPDDAADFGDSLAVGDFNHDGHDDLAVGEPAIAQVRIFTGGGAQFPTASTAFTEQTRGMPNPPAKFVFDGFGTALAAGDFNGDGAADLAIGVPAKSDGSANEAGAVYTLYGSGSSGLTTTGSQLLNQSTSGVSGTSESGDHFGASLAAGDVNGDGKADLVVGVPEESIGSVKSAGDFAYLPGGTHGLTGAGSVRYDESSTGVPGTPSTDDQMGASVAVGDFTGDGKADIAVGAPEDQAGSPAADGGTVLVFKGSSSGPSLSGVKLFSQATSGVNGTPEDLDFFGNAVHAAAIYGGKDDALVIGARLESSGSTMHNGYAVVLPSTSAGPTGTGSALVAQSGPGNGNDADFGNAFG
ncbi:MAG TPA: FG-GAP repeat protein [Micromonosporaceae bacterium]